MLYVSTKLKSMLRIRDPITRTETNTGCFLPIIRIFLRKRNTQKLEEYLVEEGILFRQENLEKSLLHVLNSKLPKTAGYKRAAHDYIASGDNLLARREDLSKTMETWLLIEDVTPCTSFEAFKAAFSSDRVLSALEGREELAGLIYVFLPGRRNRSVILPSSTMT